MPDSYVEMNGVARTSAALDAFARGHGLPFLAIHAGPELHEAWNHQHGGHLQLPRSRLALRLESDLSCDLLFWRHARRARHALATFRPDVIHITGPNDVGQLGAWLAWRLQIPLVASWHTNLPEFAAERTTRRLGWLPSTARQALGRQVERLVRSLAMLFYRVPRVLLAPNAELVALLQDRTGKPARLMQRGVETELFSPARRDVSDGPFRIGFVGRLSPEKNVRMLAAVERELVTRGAPEFQFVVVGSGGEREWLARHMSHVEFTGVLRDAKLARAYANMDVLLFPSVTDTFGLVVLEALACGTPALVTPHGGPKSIVEHGVSGFVAETTADFVMALLPLMTDPARLRAMRHAARTRALQFSWDRTFETVYRAYADAIAAPTGHGGEAALRA